VVSAWAYFILTGSVSQIWPMFGIANQLLAAVALAVGTTVILKSGRRKAALATLLPMAFVSFTTIDAGVLSIRDNFLPLARQPGSAFTGWLDAVLTAILISCVIVILAASLRVWLRELARPAPHAADLATERASHRPDMPDGCC
jgi:carbon starvation protein